MQHSTSPKSIGVIVLWISIWLLVHSRFVHFKCKECTSKRIGRSFRGLHRKNTDFGQANFQTFYAMVNKEENLILGLEMGCESLVGARIMNLSRILLNISPFILILLEKLSEASSRVHRTTNTVSYIERHIPHKTSNDIYMDPCKAVKRYNNTLSPERSFTLQVIDNL
ncbi:hypothetical protein KUTeg_003533 [Tegillarca granosa]|uniref:Uncharacterized protein n=1 Tax=Tegillarca granosa TaxID=220873 RepID=A0ABQ9FMD4_TEGGR|nr:hypothetical protein KUTeg_003533 [Tegillarca granosa]